MGPDGEARGRGGLDKGIKNGRLGTWKELCENDVTEKLMESEPRQSRDPLTPERARLGAEYLAAAVIFTRCFNLLVPDSSHNLATASSALLPERALPGDWQSVEVRALLSRALFDGAAYGRIRFHHRISAEYLAAGWLKRRMREGCSYPVLERLLFDERYGKVVVAPSTAKTRL